MTIKNLLLVGGGNMGQALTRGWLEQRIASGAIVVVEPASEARERLGAEGLVCVDSAQRVGTSDFDAVVFAVKPQQMAEILPDYRRFASPGTVFISIAAGRSLSFLTQHLGSGAPAVRAMPNTPAAVGAGITVLCANQAVTDRHRAAAAALLGSVGETAWITDETLMDAVTAVSGSGPAYVFLLIETLAAAGETAGLPASLALQLARATVAGAAQLAVSSPQTPAELRRQVTSPGGTTEAALAVLCADPGLARLLENAVLAARDRSRALGAD